MKEKNGLTGEYNFHVGVMDRNNGVRFVTEVDHLDKTARWEQDKPALVMTKQAAIQLQMGLLCNGYNAVVIEVPDFINFTNPKVLYKKED